ncbi:uncharacterized protein LOC104431632 [Eucalyptus grandis]|uniref:uncharacterized protein LOC104431632 n=1 Tax=Eucalyptus grandis TaxID=71139 RepID=UPI00192EA2B2|nr:uncharacterized protein LOC104431632 [Eucalyptus grandis]
MGDGGPARHRERHVGGEGLRVARQGGGVGLSGGAGGDGADVAGAWRGDQRRRADRHGLRWSWGAWVAEVGGVVVARLRPGVRWARRAATVLAPATSGSGSGVAGVRRAVLALVAGCERRGRRARRCAGAGRHLASGGRRRRRAEARRSLEINGRRAGGAGVLRRRGVGEGESAVVGRGARSGAAVVRWWVALGDRRERRASSSSGVGSPRVAARVRSGFGEDDEQ